MFRKFRRFPVFFAAAISSAFCLAALAEESVEDADSIEEITVLGSRLSPSEHQPPDTIVSEQIVAIQAATVGDLMRTIPGISVMEPGGPGGLTELFVRGADANFTTVFVNGVPMNDPIDARGGAFDFSSVSPVEIRRVEVVKGPFSALYGSGALAGAINIDTRAPASDSLGGLFQASLGTDGYWQLGGSVHGPVANGHAGLSANHIDYGEPTTGSTRTVSSVNGDYYAQIGRDVGIDLTLRANQRDRTGYPAGSGGERLAVLPLLESSEADEVVFGASSTWAVDGKSVTASLSYLDREELTETPGIPPGVFPDVPGSVYDNDFNRFIATFQSSFKMANGIEWGAGLEYLDESGESNGFLDFGFFQLPTDFRHDRETISPFAEARMSVGERITAFAGLRYDDFSDTDSTTSPRVGATYLHAPGGAEFSVTWGEGRKAPSFFALGNPLVGNPELEPIDSSGWDISLTIPLAGDALGMNVAVYQYRYTNLIDFDWTVFRLVNRSKVDMQGLELQFTGAIGDPFRWQISASMNENEVNGEEDGLLHRPEHVASAWLYWTPNDLWEAMFSAKYEGSRPSSSVPGGPETLPSFTRFDVAVSRMVWNGLRVQLALDNLFDEEYEFEAGFPSPGRQLRLGLRKDF